MTVVFCLLGALRRSKSLVFAILVFAVAASAMAQSNGPSTPSSAAPQVEALVERALSRAPSLAARRERIQAAQASARAADSLPNPMFEFMYQSFNFPRYTIGVDSGSMAGASIRQNLLSGGRRTAARGVANAEATARAAEQRLLAADIATEVRVQYARLYAIDRERETLSDADQLVRMIEATVSARYAAGQADQASLLRVQLEQTRIGQRVADLLAERIGVQAAINRLTNDPLDTNIGIVGDLPPRALPADLTTIPDQVAAGAPAVSVAKSNIEIATRQVTAARQELKPSWTIGGAYYWQGGFDRMVNFNVGVELPLWKQRKQLPLIAAAEGDRRAAQMELTNTTLEIRAEATRLVAEYTNAVAQIARYKDALLPQNSAALDATRASYLGGRGDFVSVLEEFRRWIDLRTELAGREADRFIAQSRIEALLAPPSTSLQ